MPVFISLLRGINVGGHNKIKMETLRSIYESLELRNVQSLLQSGNVVFETDRDDQLKLTIELEDVVEKEFGFRPKTILRTFAELKDVIKRNPFTDQDRDPSRLLVMFLENDPTDEAKQALQSMETTPEEIQINGQEVYLYYPNDIARSKLTNTLIEKKLSIKGTARNWNTITKLIMIAEAR
jgi:uncharacterized protein (DUF1697 family)